MWEEHTLHRVAPRSLCLAHGENPVHVISPWWLEVVHNHLILHGIKANGTCPTRRVMQQ